MWVIDGLLIAVVVLTFYLTVYATIWNYRRRARLTPEEREADDEEARAEMQRW